MEKLKIFISGTQDDMKPERDAVDQAVVSLQIANCIRAEKAFSQPQSPREWIEHQLYDCNIYIGIFSHRYGWVIPEEKVSATEFELNLARKLGKPILIWIRDMREDEKGMPDFEKQIQFLNHVSDFSKGYLRQTFNNPDDLKISVPAALRETLIEIVRNSTETKLSEQFISMSSPIENDIQTIIDNFSRIASRNLRRIQTTVPGMKEPFIRNEIALVEEQLLQGRPIILTGDAGTGKSGIAAIVAQNARRMGKAMLLIDAREIGNAHTEKEIKNYLDLNETLNSALKRVSHVKGCRVVIDQLDNIAGIQSAQFIVELIQEIVKEIDGVELLVVCRNKESHEQDLLRGLLSSGLTEIICNEITQEQVSDILTLIGINNYSSEVLDFGKNLLNLELMGQIHVQQPDFDFSALTDVVYLWEKYIDIWRVREGRDIGEDMFRYAVDLSKLGLNHPDGMFERELPAPISLQRLVSWGIISHVDGRMCRFRHEKFQDYIYARDAADRLLLPQGILNEIPDHKSRNVFRWVESIYSFRKSSMRLKFFEEAFNV
jgi:hypothetical protein